MGAVRYTVSILFAMDVSHSLIKIGQLHEWHIATDLLTYQNSSDECRPRCPAKQSSHGMCYALFSFQKLFLTCSRFFGDISCC